MVIVKVLKTIRELEKQKAVPADKRARIIMTTALGEVELVQTAFSYGCEAFASKPLDIAKFIEALQKWGITPRNNK